MNKERILRVELSRLELITNIVERFRSGRPEKDFTEISNIIERWLITLSNDYLGSDVDVIFDKRKLLSDTISSKNLLKESKEKHFSINWEPVFDSVNNWIDSLNLGNLQTYPAPVLIDNIIKIQGHYIHVIPPDRFDAINSCCADIYDLAILCVRYSCILQRGQQWTNSLDLYRLLVERYNLDIEGFSSPLNSQLLQIKPRSTICSLFQDTDSIFGSLGSFFKQDFVGKNVAAFLPYIEDVFNSVLELVISQCERAELSGLPIRFFIGTAGWDDTKIVETLNSYKHTKKKISTAPFDYFFHDTKNDNVVVSSFKNYFYVVSVNIDDSYDSLDAVFSSLKSQTSAFVSVGSKLKHTNGLNDLIYLFNKSNNYHVRKFICDKVFFNRVLPPRVYKQITQNKTYSSQILYEILSSKHQNFEPPTISNISNKFSF